MNCLTLDRLVIHSYMMCRQGVVWRLTVEQCLLAAKQLHSLCHQKSVALYFVGRTEIRLFLSRELCFILFHCCLLDIVYEY
jgi:hypothetical protein